MILESTDLQTLISAIIALILAIIAVFNKQRTDIVKSQQTATATAPMAQATGGVGFGAVRDGSKILNGLDGWYARINPSPQAATLPDNKCWQAVSSKGVFLSGDKDTIIYLITHADAAGWRARNG